MTRRIRTYTFMESMIYKKSIDILYIKNTSKIKFEKIEFAKLIQTLQTKSKYILTSQAISNKKLIFFSKCSWSSLKSSHCLWLIEAELQHWNILFSLLI